MKQLLVVLALLAPAYVHAQDAAPEVIGTVVVIPLRPEPAPLPAVSSAPAKVDSMMKLGWSYVTDNGSALHFLDNGTAASLYDFNRKEWLGGVMTALYTPQVSIKGVKSKPLSLDAGIVGSLEKGHAAFPFAAVRFHGRELLDQHNKLKSFFESRQNLVKYLTCGGWAARDFNIGEFRYGAFIGAEAKW